ncbi:hypothetical protein N7499_000569 [Penicillium canescens]|uniref:BZIP domain-containing protein n=1 Tax=Penicillium canescens TaxID=5083 RepID=A0AAD6NBA5_PENCN|nr:uncharacterized protein N7446_011229 [Penicillium canescens]KAJ6004501.1 hypothetical protein N7522_006146 [Penicillium canescens]KAJ6029421.1 hypothetical protein N7444_012408 [Penicillium canescens]KAJ6047852.1 hypothetical protein N7460_003999 [Penicillium canescens]KAJ6048546.1 hypothetical protein N7446_011229 [Penicillium canescens]KAJ6100939.1 hypothetical protein N7499_000569 [Penicillium canescens]
MENDIIFPTGTHPSSSTVTPSESPVPGSLNFSIASRSSSSSHNNLSPFDFSSFTTDYQQQPWLPSPPHTQPLASNQNNNNSNNNSSREDFVLYPSAPRPQPRRDSRAPTVNTTLRPSALQPFLAQNNSRRNSFNLQLHRHLQQQLSGSPVPDPRVTQLARSPSYWSHPTFKHTRHHAASVPSNSPHTNRPPIPLFNGQASNQQQNTQTYRRIMSTPNFLEAPHDDLFGLPSAGFNGMDSPLAFDSIHMGDDELFSGPPGTISPKDLMMDSSVPPSGTFTDLSTPSFESPGNFSQNTSPMFTDMDLVGHEEWPSLFDGSEHMNAFDVASLDVAAVLAAEQPKKPSLRVSVAPSSPASPALKRSSPTRSSPVPASGGVKHSSIAGVCARSRKNLSPVEFDPNDPVAAKRARNTEAARKSRAKKMERQAVSERRIEELEDIIAARDEEIAKLKAQLQIQNTFQ